MGLHQAQGSGVLARWWLPGLVLLGSALTLLLGEDGLERLRYDRQGIVDGEWFRLISGHFVHLGGAHLLFNLAGLLLVWFLVGAEFAAAAWLAILLWSIATIDLGFWLALPELEWYVGLSGVLHGLLVAGTIGLWRHRRTEALALLLIVAAKLAYEAFVGPLPGSEQSTGGEVITEAHLLGAVGGALAGFLLSIRVSR